jgi:hypothetical protein
LRRIVSRIFGPKRDEVTGEWRVLQNEDVHNLSSSPNVIKKIKSRDTIAKGKRGIYWNFSKKLEDLDFADSLCLLSQNFRDMNQKVKDLIKIAKGAGLKISTQKSKIM